MIKLVIFDIDGVLTDGTAIISEDGHEQKRINLKDVDAVFEICREGYKIAAITGENTEITGYFEKRFPWEYFVRGCKDKVEAMKDIMEKSGISKEEICYIGDGKYDIKPLEFAGLGICPGDAIDDAKKSADIILKSPAGTGGLWEAVSILKNAGGEKCAENYFIERISAHMEVFKKMAADSNLMNKVMKAAEKIAQIKKSGGQIFICEDGGSTEDVLQLKAEAKSGDMVIGISADGRSENVSETLRYGKNNHLYTVMLMGDFYGDREQICDILIKVPSTDTREIQEIHIFIRHLWEKYVMNVL